jgi:predicted transposase YdaD
MQDYDVTLKLLLRGSASRMVRELAGSGVEKWLDIELPRIQSPRLDLLGEAQDGSLVHVELQSTNDAEMPLRMAEYCLGVYRQLRRFPRQVVLYVGRPPLSMESELRGGDALIRYRTVDIRDFDGEWLLQSPEVGDNVIAILARWRDEREGFRRILERLAGLAAPERERSLSQLFLLAGVRRLERDLREEARRMPIFIDINENEVLGPPYRKGLAEGRQEGELALLRRQIQKRFGSVPAWAEEQLGKRSSTELEALAERILDASSLEDLLK